MTGWLDKLRDDVARANKPALVESSTSPQVHHIWVAVRDPNPKTGDPGEVTEGWYVLRDGTVARCDQHGKVHGTPIAYGPVSPAAIVSTQIKAAWEETRTADFGRQIVYPPLPIA